MGLWDALAAGVGQGLDQGAKNYFDGLQRNQQMDLQRQELAMRQRQQQVGEAKDSVGMLQSLMQGQLRGGNNEAAAAYVPELRGSLSTLLGHPATLPDVVGGTKQVNVPLSPGQQPPPGAMPFQGPTPEGGPLQRALQSVPDWDNAQTTNTLAGYSGYALPAPELKTVAADTTVFQYNRSTHEWEKAATTPPKPMTPYEEQSLGLRKQEIGAKSERGRARNQARTSEDYARAHQQWATNLAGHIQSAVTSFMSANTRTLKDVTGAEHIQRPGIMEIESARKTAEQEYLRLNPEPAPPGGIGRSDPFSPSTAATASPDIGTALPTTFAPAMNTAPATGPTARWGSLVDDVSQKTGVPVGILHAVMKHESGGDPKVTSPAGALGLMQLMPDTAQSLGVNPHDPAQNILGGATYLRMMYDKFGNWESALAAYNAGPGALAPSKQDGRYQIWQAPYNPGYAETRNYVKAIEADLARQGGGDRVAAFYARHGIAPGASNAQ